MRLEYDLSQLPGGVRGKYYQRVRAGGNIVLLDPELSKPFPTSEAVNDALRTLFAGLNGVFNAWPYFREFLQSATTRMGIPQFVLPVFRVRKAPEPRTVARVPSARKPRSRP
jgi:hypothetical protein